MNGIRLVGRVPSAGDYDRGRVAAHLSGKDTGASEIGSPGKGDTQVRP